MESPLQGRNPAVGLSQFPPHQEPSDTADGQNPASASLSNPAFIGFHPSNRDPHIIHLNIALQWWRPFILVEKATCFKWLQTVSFKEPCPTGATFCLPNSTASLFPFFFGSKFRFRDNFAHPAFCLHPPARPLPFSGLRVEAKRTPRRLLLNRFFFFLFFRLSGKEEKSLWLWVSAKCLKIAKVGKWTTKDLPNPRNPPQVLSFDHNHNVDPGLISPSHY